MAVAQSNGYAKIQKLDSVLAARYYRQDSFDTAYIMRPATKWTFTARMNVSGTKIKTEGMADDQHFKSEMEANRKTLPYTTSNGKSALSLVCDYRRQQVFCVQP